jgi:hypothetical protein
MPAHIERQPDAIAVIVLVLTYGVPSPLSPDYDEKRLFKESVMILKPFGDRPA